VAAHGCPEALPACFPQVFFSYFLADFVAAAVMVTESPRCYGHKPVNRCSLACQDREF
jgi:hypothetical protein